MKKYLSIIVLLSLFVIGCSEQMSVNSPVNTNTSEPNWIALPSAEGMQMNKTFTTSKAIDGAKGGMIDLNTSYNGGLFGTITLTSSLVFPKGSHSGLVTFTVSHDDKSCVSSFGPSYIFNKELILNIKYTGLDLSGTNPAQVKFAYLAADGSVVEALNDGIILDRQTGTLQVIKAKLRHFSRYGFVRKTK